MPTLKNIISSTIHLFYPHLCLGCASDLLPKDNLLCLQCTTNLPHTHFASTANNPIEKKFWGRLPITAAHSEFYFSKGTLMQHLIHQLKYKGNTDIGFYLGQLMGKNLLSSGRFKSIDGLIPLPLFVDKEHKRGYNQATIICNGIADVMKIKVEDKLVIRQHFTQTQTRINRNERWDNVAQSFATINPTALQHKHWLLVDDVVTTGATLEACGKVILNTPNATLSIAALAMADI
jgi:ComF family protein